jgi:hypothetical protein
MTQQARPSSPVPPDALADGVLAGDGVDLYYHPIGEQRLEEGGALVLVTGSAMTPYERIVEWVVPDTRQPDGRHIPEHERQRA